MQAHFVEEWPAHFSPFGGKRFPMGNANIWGSERVPSTRIEIKTPLNDQIADEISERASNQNLSKKLPLLMQWSFERLIMLV